MKYEEDKNTEFSIRAWWYFKLADNELLDLVDEYRGKK